MNKDLRCRIERLAAPTKPAVDTELVETINALLAKFGGEPASIGLDGEVTFPVETGRNYIAKLTMMRALADNPNYEAVSITPPAGALLAYHIRRRRPT